MFIAYYCYLFVELLAKIDGALGTFGLTVPKSNALVAIRDDVTIPNNSSSATVLLPIGLKNGCRYAVLLGPRLSKRVGAFGSTGYYHGNPVLDGFKSVFEFLFVTERSAAYYC
jgi:hypothetical protein